VTELPLACTLDTAALAGRKARWEALYDRALLRAERAGRRLTLRFAAADGVAAELHELVGLEADCCAFLEMRVEQAAGEVALAIAAPPGAETALDAFAPAAAAPR
jgi:hypothetical protein